MSVIGELRRRVSVEKASDLSDGAGGFIRVWNLVDTVFAAIRPRRRRERVDDGRRVGVVTHVVTVRRNSVFSGDIRLLAGGATYRVLAVEDADPRRRFFDLWCEEEQA
ncbi:MAG: phage head closure protein [Pseudomonadota bacterium]